jgi:hypothetical protein
MRPTCTHTHTHTHTKAGATSAVALEFERDVLKHQTADLRDKLSKLQRDFDDAKMAMENMVPRCVCIDVRK